MQPVITYFLTGATGAVGSALVPMVLEHPEARVWMLIRADSDTALDRRLESLFTFWGVGPDDRGFRGRVRALRGDAVEADFGLSDRTYAELRDVCTHIVHSAGSVRMNLALEEARRSAIGSARNVLTLARSCRLLEKIEFVSTVGVGGRLSVVPETWLDVPRAFHNTYEQAKAEAEDMVRREAAHELPLTVHRPSMVVGAARTGRILHFQIFYHLCEFLSGRRTLGLFPRLGQARLDTVPVDAVAGAIAWSSRQPTLAGRVLHLCSGPTVASRLTDLRASVRRLFAAHGLRVPPTLDLPSPLFRIMLGAATRFVSPELRRAAATLPVFLDYLATDQRFENAESTRLLKGAGLQWPTWDRYLGPVLTAYLAAVYPSSGK